MKLLWSNHEMYNPALVIFPVHILPNNRWALSSFPASQSQTIGLCFLWKDGLNVTQCLLQDSPSWPGQQYTAWRTSTSGTGVSWAASRWPTLLQVNCPLCHLGQSDRWSHQDVWHSPVLIAHACKKLCRRVSLKSWGMANLWDLILT